MGIREEIEVTNGFFLLEIGEDDEETKAAFKICSGLSYETEIVISEQNFANGVRSYKKRPGRINYGDIDFERGLAVGGSTMSERLGRAEMGQPDIEDMSIKVFMTAEDMPDNPAAQWDLKQGWISGWSMSDLDATDDEVLIQTLRITHEGMTKII